MTVVIVFIPAVARRRVSSTAIAVIPSEARNLCDSQSEMIRRLFLMNLPFRYSHFLKVPPYGRHAHKIVGTGLIRHFSETTLPCFLVGIPNPFRVRDLPKAPQSARLPII